MHDTNVYINILQSIFDDRYFKKMKALQSIIGIWSCESKCLTVTEKFVVCLFLSIGYAPFVS